MSLKLIAQVQGTRVIKIRAAANFAGVPLEHEIVRDWSITKTPEFLAQKNPNGKLPVLQTPEGCIFESGAILRHIARVNPAKNLYGTSTIENSQVDQWIDWNTTELEPALFAILYPIFGYAPADQQRHERAWTDLKKVLAVLDGFLANRTFLVGNQITVADIGIVANLWAGFTFVVEDKVRTTIPNVVRWYETIANQEPFQAVVGRTRYCQVEFPATNVAAAPAPAKQQQPKAAPKPPEKPGDTANTASNPAAEEEDPAAAAEKKEKNPLDLLPATNFSLYDFKTLFVNAPNKNEPIEFLWKNIDPQGFSLWHIQYQKAPGEGVKLFLTNNLKNGFLQRLDHFRKYAFGVHGVYGEEGNYEIRGVWLWRGTEIPLEMKEHPQFEWHTIRRLDINSEQDRKTVQEYWTGLDEGILVDGLISRDVTYFK